MAIVAKLFEDFMKMRIVLLNTTDFQSAIIIFLLILHPKG